MRHAALLVAVLVLLVPAAPLAASSTATPAAPAASQPGVAQSAASQAAADTAFNSTVVVDVHVRSSGDARFNVSTVYRLNSSAERAAFERVAANFSEGRIGFQADSFREVASAAAERTGRSMEITDVRRIDEVRNASGNATWNATGVLALEFTWTDFARKSGNRILLGDVFAVGSGWLDLEPGMQLRIHSPPQYGVLDADIAPSGGTLVWNGSHSFEAGQPQVIFEGGLRPTSTTSGTSTAGPGPGGFDAQFRMVLAALAVLLVGGLLAYVWTRRTPPTGVGGTGDGTGPDDGPAPEAAASSAGTGDDQPPAARSPESQAGADATADAEPAAPQDGDGGSAAAASDRGDGDESEDGGDGAAAIDEELLSDEERVERMLRANGGRMKQANIVTETGWSNAKVSQLLSGMDEDGRIEKLRLGRENLIILPDADEGDVVGGDGGD